MASKFVNNQNFGNNANNTQNINNSSYTTFRLFSDKLDNALTKFINTVEKKLLNITTIKKTFFQY